MKLISMELQGFKSFPDKTVLNFNSGVTVVVGPNGSGKSNLSDAVRWVLGELSAKSIRGSKMEDVIFGGTKNRRPMGFCEVSLTIDNTDQDNRMAIDYDTVTVTRRYYRTGESEYRINHKPVRLKDITELFMNTGIGRTGYSIIGQGQAAQIMSQKTEDRRMIFEEAAGISKYRARKNEAERKLREVEENMIRIGDILSELETRVGPLEKESIKAREYLDLYDQKKKTDIAAWLYDINTVMDRSKKLDEEYTSAQIDLENADREIEALEAKAQKLREELGRNKVRYEEILNQIAKLKEMRFRIEGSEKVHENEILHMTAQISEAESAIASASKALSEAKLRLSSLTAGLSETQAELSVRSEEYEADTAKIAGYDVEIEKLNDGIEDARKQIDSLTQEHTSATIELGALEASDKSNLSRKEAVEKELAGIDTLISDADKQIEKVSETVGLYQSRIDEQKKVLSDTADLSDKLTSDKEKTNSTITGLELDTAARTQRAETLRRMEEHFEGYAASVRAVMTASDEGRLSGVVGPVSRIISVDPEYAVAIETALGANIQNIVVKDDGAAKSAIKYLKETHGGRATFYPLSTIRVQYPEKELTAVSQCRGYIAVASELVTCDDEYTPVNEFLLARTFVFDNIDNAAAAAAKFRYKLRAVTADGQLINAGGSFTGGSVKRDSGILTRSSEINSLDREIASLKKRADKARSELEEIQKAIDENEKERQDASNQLSILSSLMAAEKNRISLSEMERSSAENRRAALLETLASLESESEAYTAEHDKLASRIVGLESSLDGLRSTLDGHLSERDRITAEQSDLQQKRNELLLRMTELRSAADNTASSIETVKTEIFNLEASIDDNEKHIAEIKEKLADTEKKISMGKENSDRLLDNLSALEAELAEIKKQDAGFDKKDEELRARINEARRHRETVFRAYAKLENQRSNILSEQDDIISRLWEEYELTYSSATELDIEPLDEQSRKKAKTKQNELRNKLRALGPVNVNAIEEYAEVRQRYDFMSTQYADLTKSKSELTGVIFRLEDEMRTQFSGVMTEINRYFKITFKELFGGGTANLSFENPDDVLTSGIIIEVYPPGKIIKNLSALSGGEQALVSIALLFAILKVNPTPFCVFDEIESALDEINVTRFAEYTKSISDKTQFIVISHRRGTMETADTLYGVTMQEKGVSTVLSVNVDEVEKRIGDVTN
ncbi:MAG: chromosome segregation protein SMC [Clostridia bacterium]|nr:chromosome segregation protein SMC [Clostridia bacterium]